MDEIHISNWITELASIAATLERNFMVDQTIRNQMINGHLQTVDAMLLLAFKSPEMNQPSYFMKNEQLAQLYNTYGNEVRNLIGFPAEQPSDRQYWLEDPIYLSNGEQIFLPVNFTVDWQGGRQAILHAVFDLSAILESIADEVAIGQHELYIINSAGQIIFQINSDLFNAGDTLKYDLVAEVKKGLSGESRLFQTNPFQYQKTRYLGNFAVSQYIDWGIVVVDQYKVAYALVQKVKEDIIYIVAIALILGILFSVIFARSFSKTISYLAGVARKIGQGNLDVQVKIPSRDEIGQLAGSLQEMVNSLREAVSVREKLVAIEQEVKIASRIQQSILPKSKPDMAGLSFDAKYLPMEGVAGDFYDFHMIDEHRLGVLVADVSGHGIPAALVGAMVKIAFSQQRHIADQPGAVLKEMNQTLSGKIEDQFLTACYILIDLKKKKLVTADAGHPPLIIWRRPQSKLEKLKPTGMVMGWMADVDFPAEEFKIAPGDRIVLYTDGIIEAQNADKEQFQESRFVQLIEKTQQDQPGELIDRTVQDLNQWVSHKEGFDDDLTMVVIDINT